MKKLIFVIALSAIAVFSLAACEKDQPINENAKSDPESTKDEASSILQKIDAEEAKEMMGSTENIVILDVRTEEEYNSGHIKGAILIPDNEIETKAEDILDDKSTTLLVYCRSGRRSALAAQTLSDLGYTAIYDFGGIIDWPYDIVND